MNKSEPLIGWLVLSCNVIGLGIATYIGNLWGICARFSPNLEMGGDCGCFVANQGGLGVHPLRFRPRVSTPNDVPENGMNSSAWREISSK